jgi:hypothetical protein
VIILGLAAWAAPQPVRQSRAGSVMRRKGCAELRPDARYNRDAELISDKFALGVDILNVIAEGAPNACTTSYPVMETLDRFAWDMRNVEGVAQVITLPMAAKIVNGGWNEGNIRWRVLPRDNDTLRQDTQGFETDSGLLNADCSAMPVMMFLTDHRADDRPRRRCGQEIPRRQQGVCRRQRQPARAAGEGGRRCQGDGPAESAPCYRQRRRHGGNQR